MLSAKFLFWSALAWITLAIFHRPVAGLLQYSATELRRLRFHLFEPPPAVLRPRDDILLPRRRYIYRGSRRNFHIDNSKPIQSFWSSTRRPRRNTGRRRVDPSLLAGLPRSASATVQNDNSTVNFGLLNIRSLTSKGHLVQHYLTDRKFDFLCLTETWQQPNDFSHLNDATPPGFVFISQPRGSGRGGGLTIIHREKWKVIPVSVPASSSFECIACKLSGPTPTIVATVYRPPRPHSEFLNDTV